MPAAQVKGTHLYPVLVETPPVSTSSSSETKSNPPDQTLQPSEGRPRKSFKCGLEGHIARACPYLRSSRRDTEARGHKEETVTVMQMKESNPKEQIEDLRRQLCEAELSGDVQEAGETLSVVSAIRGTSMTPGPRPRTARAS